MTSKPPEYEAGQHVFVHRPDGSFPGVVTEVGTTHLRITGRGVENGTYYNDWFPVRSKLQWVTKAGIAVARFP